MISSRLRNGLLVTTSLALLAACEAGGSVASVGEVGPVTVNPGGSGGSGGGDEDRADVSFVPEGFTCPAGLSQVTATVGGSTLEACQISAGTIVSDLDLPGTASGERVGYLLEGSVFVGENAAEDESAQSATLTIGAGAIIMGRSGEDALFVSPGSDIEAVGTENLPIVMTSASDAIDGSVDDGLVGGSRDAKGQWGGLVISGLARINDCDEATATPGTAECTKTGEGGSGLFGGADDDDDSGELRYVRVQYAGFLFNDEDELNGIALQGVGEGTELSFLQVHNGQDDGIEWFGGTADADHIVVTGARDDSLDWTDGWRGEVQYALVVQDSLSANRGMEGDNRGNDVNVGADEGVRSAPVFSNFTLFGSAFLDDPAPEADDGLKLRAGTAGVFANGIVIGFVQGVDYDQDNDIEDSSGQVIRVETSTEDPELYSLFVAASTGEPFDSEAAPLFNAEGHNNEAANAFTVDGVIPGVAENAVEPTDVSDVVSRDVDIEDTDFIGAFENDGDGDDETNDDNWTTGWTLAGTIPGAEDTPQAQGCPEGTTTTADAIPAGRFERNVCLVPREVLEDTTLTAGNLYKLDEPVFVGTDAGPDADAPDPDAAQVTLTIAPGVTVYGTSGETAIFVNRGSQLEARGTRGAPIIFTSQQDVLGQPTGRGQFGGLVLSGRAGINDCDLATATPGTAQCEKTGEGGSGLFGGNDDEDDSGALEFVQVRYAGFLFNDEDELNGIAFQGTGSGTEVDFVQVHQGQDDGIEWFGGTTSAKHVVITGARDDSLDWTDGWRGTLQYALVVQDDEAANRGMEGDNRGNDVNVGGDEGVRSNPTIANFTLFGSAAGEDAAPEADDGLKLRAGTDGLFANGIVVGFRQGVDYDLVNEVDEDTGRTETSTVDPEFYSIYVDEFTDSATDGEADATTTGNNIVAGEVNGNDQLDGFIPTDALLMAVSATELDDVAGDDVSDAIEDADYVGAFDPDSETNEDNWTTGWTFQVSPSLPNVSDQ